MGTVRAKIIQLPGTHGLNTTETTLIDETARFAAVLTNCVVDSAGKLASRQDFVNQTSGFSNTVKALYVHPLVAGTETVYAAAAGVLYSGTSTLTSRYDYRAGAQRIDVGSNGLSVSNGTATGLANDATTYGMTVAVNGGAAQQVTVTGSAAQTYSNLVAAITADLTGASCSLSGGVLQIVSASNGVGSTIAITNSAGTASVALLTTLTDFKAVRVADAGTITDEDWQFASLSGEVFLAQIGRQFTALDETTHAPVSLNGQPWSNSVNCVIAAYGRAWAADDETGGNRFTLWWSNLLDGRTWNFGDAGSLDLTNAWPNGQDSVVAIAAAFSRMIIFGRRSILMYTMPADNDPASMSLTDVFQNIGCVARDSVQVTDTGVYFLSDNGVYRIDKLSQTTSLLAAPQASYHYNDEVLAQIAAETGTNIRSGYYPTEGYYVLSFPTSNKTFAIMTRRVTPGDTGKPVGMTWTNTGRPFYAFAFDKSGNWYSGGVNGVHRYSGYTPDGASNAYDMVWTAQWNPFEDESRLKHAKSIAMVLTAASGQTGTFEWRTDYLTGTTNSNAFTCSAAEFAEDPGVGVVTLPIGRSFKVMQPSLTFPINGDKVTLHQLRIYASPGAVKA